MTKDVRGSTTYDYVINHAGRIAEVKIDTVSSATYEYNAQNQLVLRSTSVAGGPAGDVHYIYDRQGHLIAEADAATGDTVREYIWLGDMPIAVVADVNTVSPIIYYVHADHLNRPVMMTDGLKANVWEAVWLPYGAAHSITGAASLDARFPGQWFHIEAGLHYNWHRHYDPTLARYTQADPLGFVDGPSVYAYALNSPQRFVDPDGRQTLNMSLPGGRVVAGICTIGLVEPTPIGELVCACSVGIAVIGSSILLNSIGEGGGDDDDGSSEDGDEEGDPDDERPDLGTPGTRRNPDGTPKDSSDQLEQIEKAQQKNRDAVRSIKKSKQNLRNDLKKWR